MEPLRIEGTNNTPKVLLDYPERKIMILGRAFPEYSAPFFERLSIALSNFEGPLEITINLEYVNTSSSKCILGLLKEIENRFEGSSVIWISDEDDEDTEELGKTFEYCLNMPFEYRVTVWR